MKHEENLGGEFLLLIALPLGIVPAFVAREQLDRLPKMLWDLFWDLAPWLAAGLVAFYLVRGVILVVFRDRRESEKLAQDIERLERELREMRERPVDAAPPGTVIRPDWPGTWREIRQEGVGKRHAGHSW